MTTATLLAALMTSGLGLLSVSLWTARVAVTARGHRCPAAVMAALEAIVFVLVFSRLLRGIDTPSQIVAYAVGVATGTVLALSIDAAFTPRLVRVDVVSAGDADRLVAALHRQGWPTTVTSGVGLSGGVATVSITAEDARLQALQATIVAADPHVFWTVSPVRAARPFALPPGFVGVGPTAQEHSTERA